MHKIMLICTHTVISVTCIRKRTSQQPAISLTTQRASCGVKLFHYLPHRTVHSCSCPISTLGQAEYTLYSVECALGPPSRFSNLSEIPISESCQENARCKYISLTHNCSKETHALHFNNPNFILSIKWHIFLDPMCIQLDQGPYTLI